MRLLVGCDILLSYELSGVFFMVERKEYLEQLIRWKDEQVIKVVTGIRRCGKSTLLQQFQDYLLEHGTEPGQILSLNFEQLEYEELLDYHTLHAYLLDRLCADGMTYIFLDEVQNVSGFEKVVDSLYIRQNVDLYITGSNAFMLSGELATLLSGRYVQVSMLPFSFREYCRANDAQDYDTLFADYLRNGGFPYIAVMDRTPEKVNAYLEGIYNTIIVKDIVERKQRRDKDSDRRNVTDIALLESIARFLADSVGNPISVRTISNFIISSGRKVSQNTVSDYIEMLKEAYVFYPAERFDVKGKQLMKMNQKLYIVDLGIRRYLLPRSSYDLGFSLENVIFFELVRRGFSVNVGKVGNTEVDFVSKKDDRIQYFQVAASLTDQSTFDREITPLKNIHDNYSKTILTLDRFTPGNYNGIEVVNAVDWLLGE